MRRNNLRFFKRIASHRRAREAFLDAAAKTRIAARNFLLAGLRREVISQFYRGSRT
jgi:hypothetical protein